MQLRSASDYNFTLPGKSYYKALASSAGIEELNKKPIHPKGRLQLIEFSPPEKIINPDVEIIEEHAPYPSIKEISGFSVETLKNKKGKEYPLQDTNSKEASIKLQYIDLSWMNMAGFDLSTADLLGADLSLSVLSLANLCRANLWGANLAEASLIKANLTGANLGRADLTGTNLTRADLTDADLSEAVLKRNDIIGANFTNANLSETTIKISEINKDHWLIALLKANFPSITSTKLSSPYPTKDGTIEYLSLGGAITKPINYNEKSVSWIKDVFNWIKELRGLI